MIDTFKHLIDPDIYNVDCELTWTRGVPVCMWCLSICLMMTVSLAAEKTDKQIEMQYKSGADARRPKKPRIRWKCAAVPSGE